MVFLENKIFLQKFFKIYLQCKKNVLDLGGNLEKRCERKEMKQFEQERQLDVDVTKLKKLSIFQLREVGSRVGVKNPTGLRSKQLREAISDIVCGKVAPYRKTKSGRPHKQIIKDEDWDRLVGFENSFNFTTHHGLLSLYSPVSSVYSYTKDTLYDGYVLDVEGEMRVALGTSDQLKLESYAIITTQTTHFAKVQNGDKIKCRINSGVDKATTPVVTEITAINDVDANSNLDMTYTPAPRKKPLEFKYPQLQFLNKDYPVHLGRRALFVGQKQSGQEYLANSIAKDLSQNFKVVYFSGNKNPEDRLEFNKNVEYFFSTFDVKSQNLVFQFEMAFHRAKNLAQKYDVIFIVDDLNDLMQKYVTLFDKQKDDTEQLLTQQFKSLLASSKLSKDTSMTIFAFASTPEKPIIADCMHQVDILCNCHFALDNHAFVSGEDEFLDRPNCKVDALPRSID